MKPRLAWAIWTLWLRVAPLAKSYSRRRHWPVLDWHRRGWKSGRGLPHTRTLARAAELLECGSPLLLWIETPKFPLRCWLGVVCLSLQVAEVHSDQAETPALAPGSPATHH